MLKHFLKFKATGIEHRILDVNQGHGPRSVTEGSGEVIIKTSAAAIAKLPPYKGAERSVPIFVRYCSTGDKRWRDRLVR